MGLGLGWRWRRKALLARRRVVQASHAGLNGGYVGAEHVDSPPDALDFVGVQLHCGLGHGGEQNLQLVRQAVDVRRQIHLARAAVGDVLVHLTHRWRQHALQTCSFWVYILRRQRGSRNVWGGTPRQPCMQPLSCFERAFGARRLHPQEARVEVRSERGRREVKKK